MKARQFAGLCAWATAVCLAPTPAETEPDLGPVGGVVLSSAAPRLAAAVYKWIDEQGIVHYGDCPPEECTAEQLPVAPPPSPEAVREAEERARLIRALTQPEAKASEAEPRAAAAATEPSRATDVHCRCFLPLPEVLNGRIADSRVGPVRTPLANGALRDLNALFNAMEGRWSGSGVETTCIQPRAEPPETVEHLRLRAAGRWKSDRVFELEVKQTAAESGRVSREFFWFLLSPDGLRARTALSDHRSDLDSAGNDVETLVAARDRLLFFWRRGGPTRRVTLIELHKTARGFTLSKWSFVQGVCSGSRTWELRG
jgi:hypothetical protein